MSRIRNLLPEIGDLGDLYFSMAFSVVFTCLVFALEQYLHYLGRFATSTSAPIVIVYLLMVFLSRWLVRLFKPFQLQRLLLFHNFICSIWSLYCFLVFMVGMLSYGFPRCLMVMEQGNQVILHAMKAYWLSKIFELMDTVYMLLKHKLRQMSFLHVWHHATITLLADYAYHYLPFPAFVFILMMNSFIHVIMYCYYGLTALYPLHQFAWKRRITQLQIVQFLLGILHGVYGYLHHGFCIYSILYGVTMMALFGNFYHHAFMKTQKLKK